MDTVLAQRIQENMRTETTEKLLQIWGQNDREEWSEEAFEAIRALLTERGFTPPPQAVARRSDPKREGPDLDRAQRVRETLKMQPTEKLLEIWRQNDREGWSQEAFLAIRALLIERGVTPPLQPAETDEYSPGQPPDPHQEDISTGLGWVCAILPLVGFIVALLNLISGHYRKALQAFVLPVANIAWYMICSGIFQIPGMGGYPIVVFAFPIGGLLVVPFVTLHLLRKYC